MSDPQNVAANEDQIAKIALMVIAGCYVSICVCGCIYNNCCKSDPTKVREERDDYYDRAPEMMEVPHDRMEEPKGGYGGYGSPVQPGN